MHQIRQINSDLAEAIAIYQSMGFQHIAPYHGYPPRLMPFLVSVKKSLA